MISFIYNVFSALGKVFGVLSAIFFSLFFAFLAYVWVASENHLVQYDGTPCQNKIMKLNKSMKSGIGNESTINPAFYYITHFILQDINEDWVTIADTHQRYSKGSELKIRGYYKAYKTGPLSSLGGNGGGAYLVESIEDKKLFWIISFDFSVQECNVCDSFEGNGTSVSSNFKELNITETEIFK